MPQESLMKPSRTKIYSVKGAARLFSLPVGLFAGAIALLTVAGHPDFDLASGLMAAVASVLVQASANFINDYSDLQNPELAQRLSEAQRRIIRLNTLLGGLCLVAAAVLGGVLMARLGSTVLWLALGGLIMMLAYNIEPVALKKKGLGMPLVALMMGPYMMPAIAWCATGTVPAPGVFLHSLLFSLPIGLLLFSNEYRDIAYDSLNGDRTLAVRLGSQASRRLYRTLLVLTVLAYTGLLASTPLMLPALIPVLALAIHLYRRAHQPSPGLPPKTGQLVLLSGLVQAAWLLLTQ
ncbi:MAG: prenyltransferase [Gammaproteobacteria bacterium]|nr:MAG: prenyltransferase [Gammaproteobacteria bacterium]